MSITELAIKRPTLVVVIFGALTLLGVYSLINLNYELLPKITPPVLSVTTIYPGASPSEVENSVTKPIENALSSLDKVYSMTSTSNEGVSFVLVRFDQSADINNELQDAQGKIDQMVATLPVGVKTPSLTKLDLQSIPVLRLGVTSNMPATKFYQFVVDNIQPQLSEIPGVGLVSLVGGLQREIRVNLDEAKLKAYGISVLQVLNAVRTSNIDFPTGKLENNSHQLVVRLAGKFKTVASIRDLVLRRSKDGGEVRLSDVAEVIDGHKPYKTITRINGVTSIGILVQKQTDANTVNVSRGVREELKNIEKEYKAENVKFVIGQDGSTFTLQAVNGVKFDLFLAIILVAVVMLLFLHSIRNSFIVMLSIPASLLSTLIVMYAMGYTLNLMTLLGFSLVIGILVDDSIVIIENIHHHLEKGEKPRAAALRGRNEIGFAALSITMVDVVIYVPLALTGGLVGNIIREFAMVVVISTLMSLFVSFTLTPLLASRIGKIERMTNGTFIGKFAIEFEKYFKRLVTRYIVLLKWSLHNRWKVVTISAVLFIATLMLAPLGFIGAAFVPQTDMGEFAVTLDMPPNYTVRHTNLVTERVERYVNSLPQVEKDFVEVGVSNEGIIGQSSNHSSELDIQLVSKGKRKLSTDQVGEMIKEFALKAPGVRVRVDPIGIFGTANQTPIQLIVNGPSRPDVLKSARILEDVVRKIPGTADVRLSTDTGSPEMRVDINRQKMAQLGLSMADVGAALQVAMQGNDDAKFRQGGDDYDILVSLDKSDKSNISDLEHLVFVNNKGQQIQLQQFARVYQSTAPSVLQRFDRIDAVTVYSQVIGRPVGTVGQEIRNAMAAKTLPPGVKITYWGDLKNQAQAFSSLGISLAAAIIFVYLVLIALYDSYGEPFIVMFSIPVAMVGAFLALALTLNSLNIFTILGIIILIGLVGKNAILLVDRANQKKREDGLSTFDALVEAGESRIRPIMMTTTAMVFGMLPLALAHDAASEYKSGLAWAIIGGLISSMFLTLVLVPVIYVMFENVQVRLKALLARRADKEGHALEPEVAGK